MSDEEPQETEEELSEALARVVDEGERRLDRSPSELAATGVVGGLDVGLGVIALAVVTHETGSPVLGALAFTIGFIALALAGSELFTENFLVPIVAAVARPEIGARAVLRLWGGTLVANVAAGWVVMAIVVAGLPQVRPELVELGRHKPDLGYSGEALASAVLAGMVMTLLTWMEQRAPSTLGRLAASVATGFLLAAASLNHAIIGALEMSAALVAGAPFGYAAALGALALACLGNMLGGIGLVTVVRLVQIGRPNIVHERRKPADRDGDQEPGGRRAPG